MTRPDTTAARIRKLVEAHPGQLRASDLVALLPPAVPGDPAITYRQVTNQVEPMCKKTRNGKEPMMRKNADGTLTLNRQRMTPSYATEAERQEAARKARSEQNRRMREKRAAGKLAYSETRLANIRAYEERRNAAKKAARHARGIVPHKQRALRIKDFSVREQIAAEAAQAIGRRQMGLRDVPAALDVESVEAWMARTGQEPERLPHGKVSKGAQFARLENVA